MHAKTTSTILKSERLRFLARHVIENQPMADIGTDHALLPIALVYHGVVPRAIAADLRPEPLKFARAHKRQFGLSDEQLEIRLGPGLEPIQANEAVTVVIAGMGGATMQRILNAHDPVALGVQRLILQPTQGAESLRQYLSVTRQWHVEDEHLLFEAERFYTNHIIDLNTPASPTTGDEDWYVGDKIKQRGGLVLQQWIVHEVARLNALITALSKANPSRVADKLDDARRRLAHLKSL